MSSALCSMCGGLMIDNLTFKFLTDKMANFEFS